MQWFLVLSLWGLLAGMTAWGAFKFSMRDLRATSWMKIAFAATLLAAFGAVRWIPLDLLGEGIVAHAALFLFYWPMVVFGAALCVGSIVGTSMAMYQTRNRQLS
jgi:hypothetical protein